MKEQGNHLGDAALAVEGLILLIEIAKGFKIGLLQSRGGVFIILIVFGQAPFFGFISYAAATGRL
jgi:hypothetical protein